MSQLILVYNFAVRPAIILFAKAPVSGRVKTRLLSRLTAEQARQLHDSFVRDALEMLQGFRAMADVELQTDIPTDAWNDFKVPRFCQVEGDLGGRMLHALEEALSSGRPKAMILGSDAVALPPGHLVQLIESSADVALGPSDDGGYYAICCRRVHPAMFDGVLWSASSTLADTRRAVEACGLSVEVGSAWYDVDTPADLDRLALDPNLARHVSEWLRRNAR